MLGNEQQSYHTFWAVNPYDGQPRRVVAYWLRDDRYSDAWHVGLAVLHTNDVGSENVTLGRQMAKSRAESGNGLCVGVDAGGFMTQDGKTRRSVRVESYNGPRSATFRAVSDRKNDIHDAIYFAAVASYGSDYAFEATVRRDPPSLPYLEYVEFAAERRELRDQVFEAQNPSLEEHTVSMTFSLNEYNQLSKRIPFDLLQHADLIQVDGRVVKDRNDLR